MGPQVCRHRTPTPCCLSTTTSHTALFALYPPSSARHSVIQYENGGFVFRDCRAAAAAREVLQRTSSVRPPTGRMNQQRVWIRGWSLQRKDRETGRQSLHFPSFLPFRCGSCHCQFSSHFVSAVISSHSRCRSVLPFQRTFWVEAERTHFSKTTHAQNITA